MAYQYKKRRKAARQKIKPAISPEKPTKEGDEEILVLEVHGRPADSKQEVMLARALDKVGIEYQYQVPLFRGRGILGGISVDFVVFIPWAVAVEVFGRYFHRESGKDKLRVAMLFQFFKQEPVIFWDDEMTNQAAVDALVRERLL